MRSLRGPWLPLLCLAVGLVAFAPGLGGEFLNFDDPFHVTENAVFRLGLVEALGRIWDPTHTIADVYLPVSFTSLYVDWLVFGPESVWGFHLQSLLWHVASGLLLALLAIDLGLPRWLAALAASLFLVHPAMAESVVWVSGRKDVVSGCFALLALLVGRRCARGAGSPWLAGGLALLASYAKGTAIVLPLLAWPLWRLAQRGPIDERRFARAFAATALACAAAAVHHWFLAARQGTTAFEGDAATVPGALLHYLRVALLPLGLAVHYPRATVLAEFGAHAAAKTAWLLAVVGLGLLLARRAPMPLRLGGWGLLLALLALLPFNTWFPASAIGAADRYLYLAWPWLALGLVAAAASVPGRATRLLSGLLAVGAVALLPMTWRRAHDFSRSDRLWQANLLRYPHDAVALCNLGDWTAGERQRAPAAERLYEEAIRQAGEPAHELRARIGLVVCARWRGDLGTAARQLERAVEVVDRLGGEARAHERRIEMRRQLAEARIETGEHEAARAVIQDILSLDASDPDALALAARDELRRAAAAAKELPLPAATPGLVAAEAFLARAAGVAGGADRLHVLLARSELARLAGRSSEAMRLAAQAQRLYPWHGGSYQQAAAIYRSEGVLDGAARELGRGVAERPDLGYLQVSLAEVLLAQGLLADAEALLRRLRYAQPAFAPARSALATVLTARARQMVGVSKVVDIAPLVAEAKELDEQAPDLLWLEAMVLQAERRPAAALAAIHAAAARQPDEPRVRELRISIVRDAGYAALLAGDKATACRHFREFLDLQPPRHEIRAVVEIMRNEFEDRFKRALDAIAAVDYPAGERALRHALELFPDHDDALLRLGMVEFATNRAADAEKTLARSVENAERRGADPGLGLFYRMRALVELGRGREALDLAAAYLRPGDERLRDTVLRQRVQELAERLRE